MSGPIVRTGTNPKFWEGWDKAFGKSAETPKAEAASPATKKKAAAKAAEPVAAVKKAVAKKAAKKTAKKK